MTARMPQGAGLVARSTQETNRQADRRPDRKAETMSNMTVMRRVAAAVVAACALGAGASTLRADDATPPLLLVVHKGSIEYGVEPYQVPPDALNDTIAAVGVRDPLPFFSANPGAHFLFRTGHDGTDSWFALERAPQHWASGPGAGDGLENFLLAGPGLGSPDPTGYRESFLVAVPDVVAIRATRALQLAGRAVCAVVYDSDLRLEAGMTSMSLQGDNLGVVAFRVLNVMDANAQWPAVIVEILDFRETCSDGVVGLAEDE